MTNERQILALLYEAFTCEWFASQIEKGRIMHPTVYHTVKRIFARRVPTYRRYESEVDGACAVGFAFLAGQKHEMIQDAAERKYINDLKIRAYAATCGVEDTIGLCIAAESVYAAFETTYESVVRMNDVRRMSTEQIVKRLRRRARAIAWLLQNHSEPQQN